MELVFIATLHVPLVLEPKLLVSPVLVVYFITSTRKNVS
jgi:hypothetical protein